MDPPGSQIPSPNVSPPQATCPSEAQPSNMSIEQGTERTEDEDLDVSAEVQDEISENEIVLEPGFSSRQGIHQRQLIMVHKNSVSINSSQSVASTNSTQPSMDVGTFRKLGVAFLIVQALTLLGFSWYAWHIENSEVEALISGTLMIWFGLSVWKVAIPYAENSFLFWISFFLAFLGHNPLYMDPGDQRHYIITSFIGPVLSIPAMEILARGLRQIATNQDQLNDLVLASLQTSIKAGLAIIYLAAMTISSIQGKSRQEIMEAIEAAQQAEEGVNSTESMPYSTLQDLYSYMEAKETTEQFQDFRRASIGGVALNLFILQSFLFVHWARLSFLDVVKYRITIAEGIEVAATIGITVFLLAYLALTVVPAAGQPIYYLGQIVVVAGLACWVQISYSIFRGKHPYFEDRSQRQQNQNQKKEEQQRPEDIFPLTSEDT